MGQYTYDVHEKCLISTPPPPPVHLRPNFFFIPVDLGRPILNEHPPPSSLTNYGTTNPSYSEQTNSKQKQNKVTPPSN